MTRLTGWDFFSCKGLRQVNRGGLAKLGEHYVDDGRPVPGFLIPYLVEALIEERLVKLGTPDAEGLRRAGLTEEGQARYRELCRTQRQRHPDPPVPPPEPTSTTETPAGHRSSSSPLPPPGGQPDPPPATVEGR